MVALAWKNSTTIESNIIVGPFAIFDSNIRCILIYSTCWVKEWKVTLVGRVRGVGPGTDVQEYSITTCGVTFTTVWFALVKDLVEALVNLLFGGCRTIWIKDDYRTVSGSPSEVLGSGIKGIVALVLNLRNCTELLI